MSPKRFRIPDVCVVLGKATEQIFRTAPFLCVEILSPEDRMKRVQERIDDYLAMGVSYVWVLDPSGPRVYVGTPAAVFHEFKGDILSTESPALELPLAELFE